MTEFTEQTFDGKLLPRHLKMFRDVDSERIELRYWKFEPILLFLIPFMSVWSGMSIFCCYVMPFLQKIRIKNGYRSEIVCAFWDDDSIEFAMSLLKRRAGISTRN